MTRFLYALVGWAALLAVPFVVPVAVQMAVEK